MIKIYTTKTCHFCKDAKQFLTEHGFSYEEVDATIPENKEEMVKISGQLGVPVITMGTDFVVGFNKAKLAKLLMIQ